MCFKIDWASLIVASKFTVFGLLYFEFEGNFPSTSPRGAYIWRGDLTKGFLRYRFEGLIFGILRYHDNCRAQWEERTVINLVGYIGRIAHIWEYPIPNTKSRRGVPS